VPQRRKGNLEGAVYLGGDRRFESHFLRKYRLMVYQPRKGAGVTGSPVERDGFEPLVPLRKGTASSETTLIDLRLLLLPEDQATPSRE
jgi:hypothetical protein